MAIQPVPPSVGRGDRRAHVVEFGGDRLPDQGRAGDDYDADQGRDHGVFDGRGAALAADVEAQLSHGSASCAPPA